MKRICCFLLSVMMLTGIFAAAPAAEVRAATSVKVQSKVRCGVGLRYSGYVNVSLVESGDTIKHLKTSSKNLVAKVTDKYENYNSPSSGINFYAKKKGTYTIKFDVYKWNGKKRTSRKVKVYASGMGNTISSVRINGKNVMSYANSYSYYTTKKSAKVKFSLAAGCKIKKIRVVKLDQNGDELKTAFKNGKKVTFSTRGYSSSYSSGGWSKGFTATTRFEITYRDSFAGENYTAYYYIYKKATKWY